MVGTVTTAVCDTFKLELGKAIHAFDADTFKVALIKNNPTGSYGRATTNYSDLTGNSDEASGTGYSAGGATLAGAAITLGGPAGQQVAYVDFTDPSWAAATVTAIGALIYNSSKGNRAVAVLSFNGLKVSTASTFTIILPPAGPTTALLKW